MSFTVYVKMKKLGRQDRTKLAPVPFLLDKKPDTLQELLIGLTELGVKDYNERREENQILPFLTKEEIKNQAERGKVSFGFSNGQIADKEQAVKNTISDFEDGIYRVFAGDTELKGLLDKISWEEDLVFTFLRLTMLSG